jgi:hypothetical protein
MVHHHRASLLRPDQPQPEKCDLLEAGGGGRMGRLADYACQHRKQHGHDALLRMLAGFALASCLLLLLPGSPVSGAMDELLQLGRHDDAELPPPPPQRPQPRPLRGSADGGTVSCDRTSRRTDVCVMRGDVRTRAAASTLLLLNASAAADERVRPYTRKWEAGVMATIDELRLRALPAPASSDVPKCDVVHHAPAVVFSTGGYTGNVYHEFNDGIIPLYLTARGFRRDVVLVVLEYHDWWMTKYAHVVDQLSAHPVVDFAADRRTHCFPEAVVGLRIHDELAVHPARLPPPDSSNLSIRDFRQMLDDAYRGRVQQIVDEEAADHPPSAAAKASADDQPPRLVIVSRNGSRAIENEPELARAAEALGFRVTVLRPRRDTELAQMYRALNACDAMVGVHGAAMTHFLFMRPGAAFIQIVPLGTDWAAETYYGAPARSLGLRYLPYKVAPRESSLYGRYHRDHPVLTDPDSVNAKGWQVTKKVYLDGQNVRIDVARFRHRLRQAYRHWAAHRPTTTVHPARRNNT